MQKDIDPKYDISYNDNKVYYALTVTFFPHFTWKQKWLKINNIDKFINSYTGTNKLLYCIEYHKYGASHPSYTDFGENDNPLRPHVHMLIETDKPISTLNIIQLKRDLYQKVGMCKLEVLDEEHNFKNFKNYVLKDCIRLDNKYQGTQHLHYTEKLVNEKWYDPLEIEYESD